MRLVRGRLRAVLDEIVEVTFTVNRRVRRIAAHDPERAAVRGVFRQIFWSSAIDLPEDLDQVDPGDDPGHRSSSARREGPPFAAVAGEACDLLDPVTHTDPIPRAKGEPTRERQSLSLVFDKVRPATETIELSPGPLRLSLENRTDARVLPGLWVAATSSKSF